MADERQRELERASATGDADAEARLIRERLRGEILAPELVGLAAYCGMESARAVMPDAWLCEIVTGGNAPRGLGRAKTSSVDELPVDYWAKHLAELVDLVEWPEREVPCAGPMGKCLGAWRWCPSCEQRRTSLTCLCVNLGTATLQCPCKGAGNLSFTPTSRWALPHAVLAVARVFQPIWEEQCYTRRGGREARTSALFGIAEELGTVREALDAIEAWLRCPCDGPCLTRVRDAQSLPPNAHIFFHVVRSSGWWDGSARTSWHLALSLLTDQLSFDTVRSTATQVILEEPVNLRSLVLLS